MTIIVARAIQLITLFYATPNVRLAGIIGQLVCRTELKTIADWNVHIADCKRANSNNCDCHVDHIGEINTMVLTPRELTELIASLLNIDVKASWNAHNLEAVEKELAAALENAKYFAYEEGIAEGHQCRVDDVKKQIRKEAIEECAKIVEDHESGKSLCAEGVAERIRSLVRR